MDKVRKFIRQNWERMSDQVMADLTGVGRESIERQRKRLGLKRSLDTSKLPITLHHKAIKDASNSRTSENMVR